MSPIDAMTSPDAASNDPTAPRKTTLLPSVPMSPEDRTYAKEKIQLAFKVEPEEAPPLVEGFLAEIEARPDSASREALKRLLRSLLEFFRGVLLMNSGEEFDEAIQHFDTASTGFSEGNELELKELADGLAMLSSAALESKAPGGSTIALKHIEGARACLRHAGKFAERYDGLFDRMSVSSSMLQGQLALAVLDLPMAKSLFAEASSSAARVAEKYFAHDEVEGSQWRGLAKLSLAFYKLGEVMNDFGQFAFDKIAYDESICDDALKAGELLKKGDVDEQTHLFWSAAVAYASFLGATQELARLIMNVLQSPSPLDSAALQGLRKRFGEASSLAAQLGPSGVAFVRFLDEITQIVNNLDRLARQGGPWGRQ